VDWAALSPEGRETLRTFGLRLAFGRSTREIAEETGLTVSQATEQLRSLRKEIKAQLGQ